ncbi:MAG: PhoU domain-containing protein [Nanoarchaeota archaeon]
MKRKIIKQGHNTLTITLPAEWTKRFNLESGKEIDLDERDNGLFISTEKNGKHKATEFDITGLDLPTIWKYFMAVYREGYDEIRVKFSPDMVLENPYKFFNQHKLDIQYKKTPEKKRMSEVLQSFVSRFIGLEIVEHGKDYVLIKEMGESTSKEFDSSLRRVFLLIQQMFEEVLEAIEKGDTKILAHTHDVDINLDKFHDYCIRILNRVGNKEPRKVSLLFATLYLLELVGDEFKNISHHMLYDFDSSVDFKYIKEVAESISEQFNLYYDMFYKFDKEKLIRMSELDKKRYFSVSDMYKKAKNGEIKEIFHHLRVIAKDINALIELRVEMEF